MEEVWNDISLSLSSIYTNRSSDASATVHNSPNFQDFFKTPKEPTKVCPPKATELSLSTTGTVAKKRGLLVEGYDEEERNKRLMKNRESADRSRARKQAYTMELEKEVAQLKKENAKLKGQLKMFNSEGYPQLPKKPSLRRSLTSPF